MDSPSTDAGRAFQDVRAKFRRFAGNSTVAAVLFSQLVLALSGGTSFSLRRYQRQGSIWVLLEKDPPNCPVFPRGAPEAVELRAGIDVTRLQFEKAIHRTGRLGAEARSTRR